MTAFYEDADPVATDQEADLRAEELRDAWARVLDTKAGRRVLWDILDRAGVYSVALTADNAVLHNEGRRSVGLSILRQIHAIAPKAYMKMQAEALADERHKLALTD